MTPETINGVFAIGGAVIGAVLSAALAYAIHNRTKEKKVLSVVFSKPKQLIDVHDSIKDSINIEVMGRKVDTASHLEYYIANTGNSVINDINIVVETAGDTEIFGGNVPASNFKDVISEDTLVSWEDDGAFSLTTKFLNPGDELHGYILLANIPSEIHVRYRQAGVQLKVTKNHESEKRDVFADLIYEFSSRNFILDSYLKLAIPAYREQRRKDEL